jgi:tRNA pseudouridine38-40 synthase
MKNNTIYRYKIVVEYNGTNYYGLQIQHQPSLPTIEKALIEAINKLSNNNFINLGVAGRTDAGVHALGQVFHFDTNKFFSNHQVVSGLNHYLQQEEIRVLFGCLVDENFHARFSVKKRTYQYLIYNRKTPSVLLKNMAWHIAKPLNIMAMQEASKFLLGCHDFSAFRDSECQAKSPIRTIDFIDFILPNQSSCGLLADSLKINVIAKSFLHHMVRNIIGTLVFVGIDKFKSTQVLQILYSKDRKKAGPTAPACGLYFLAVEY